MTNKSEAEKFDSVVRTLLSVSHEEIKKRDEEWHRKRSKNRKVKEERKITKKLKVSN